MLITRKSWISNKIRTLDIEITDVELDQWRAGHSLDKICPYLSESDKEFIVTGITDDEWEDVIRKATDG